MSSLFGGAPKPKPVPPPTEDKAALAAAEARRKAASRRGYQSTILSQQYQEATSSGKEKLGQ